MPKAFMNGSPVFNGDSSCTLAIAASASAQITMAGMNTTQGWFAARLKMTGYSATSQSSDNILFEWADDLNNYIYFSIEPRTSSGTGFGMGRRSAGVGTSGTWLAATYALNDKITIIMQWTATALFQSYNGSADLASPVANTAIPTLAATTFLIGDGITNIPPGSPQELGADVLWAAWGSGVLINADAATINGFGDTDHKFTDFPGACVGIWTADDAAYQSIFGDPQLDYSQFHKRVQGVI